MNVRSLPHKLLLPWLVAGTAWLCAAHAFAADPFPSKPVKILVGFSPGGSNDVVARLIAPKLAEGLGAQVLVDNRPGAGGNIAVSAMLTAPADGHTLLMCTTGTLSIQPHVLKSMPFDPEKDIVPVTQVTNAPYMLMVNSTLPVTSVKELVAYAKQKPGELNFASSGTATGGHLAGEMLKTRAGIDIVHVAYKGTGQAMTDLLAGQVSMIFDQPVSSMQYARSGKLRALAVASSRRLAAFPDIPTVTEAGIPDFEPVTWAGICAARNTPPAVVERIQREVARVLATPEIAKRLAADGLEPVGSTPEQFRAFLAADKRKWGRVVKDADVKAE
ncbi:tripartite tricarboxylate transporter substrate binding protein [Variovorax beijingensis]|uniref:Tripartite tricarboxylate transporter substrate binding protein n=1 Tax=Variovorax beijingensis TaxID=2496117 RepID=A0ABY0A3Q9_9BURK|nr:tripartite tricarboxylate transporter substrate binding protein [Variovorax beijingensis]RSZ32873.1 tripartite tricarboxylate transporter substrate binding protein [Variovorax beijingensis]